MTKYKKGDRVRRVNVGSANGHNGMRIGDEDVVESIDSFAESLNLEKFGEGHSARYFELVETKQPSLEEEIKAAQALVGKEVSCKSGYGAYKVEGIEVMISENHPDASILCGAEFRKNGEKPLVIIRAKRDESESGGDHSFPFRDVTPRPETAEVKLNSEYTAIVSKDSVKVGCQTFPISVVEKIIEEHGKL